MGEDGLEREKLSDQKYLLDSEASWNLWAIYSAFY